MSNPMRGSVFSLRAQIAALFGILLVILIVMLSFFIGHAFPGVHQPALATVVASTPTSVGLSLMARPTATAMPTATPEPLPSPTATARPIPTTIVAPSTQMAADGLTMLPPGSTLPTEADCAARVQRTASELRPENYAANHSVPGPQQLAGLDPKENKYGATITGNFTGTTSDILQWVACKWGIDPELVRAQAYAESSWVAGWHDGPTSDQKICPPGTWDGSSCSQYWGILQITYQYWKSAWPMMHENTAFSAEYAYGWMRMCYDGLATYYNTPVAGYAGYHAGDMWGCVGAWGSGQWYAQNSLSYITDIKNNLARKTWLKPGV